MEYDVAVDRYAYGVILWELITRKMYFGDVPFLMDVENNIRTGI